jgi:sec-independent protein translocase protein TatC
MNDERPARNELPEEGSEAEGGMSFLEHLEEFRWTVARSLIAFVIGVAVVLIFHKNIAEWIQLPLHHAYGSAEVARENLITYKAMGVITVFLQIALLGGLTLSMPFGLYFLGAFVAPGLTDSERKILRPACVAAFVLFMTGAAFAFFVILPLALSFTVRLNERLGFDIFWAASDYYNMVVWFSLGVGAFFQFPLVVVVLVYLGVLTTEVLKRVRRAVFVGLMIFSALVSPGGDPISLFVTTGFMYGLYELAIWTGARIEKKKREAELASWEEE